ncbi:CU044_5270 family protein [Streptomyces sp. 5-6(2022)]|uniref:CU044_5270 family protein n=1 Tax=Streptomyces sp. 5-6(2022) TaxID=2936510 RepID=UPI0023B9AEDA|nr:CU044_5270 family protein [Streptomyces sp. 5-6(2022)]
MNAAGSGPARPEREREDAAYEDTAREELARLLPPVPAERDVPSAPYLHHKDRLMQHIDDDQNRTTAAATAPARTARRRLLRPALLMPAAGLALAGALAVTLTAGGDSGDGSHPRETATVLLDRIAGTAAKSDVKPVRQDQFVYVKSVTAGAEMKEDGSSTLEPPYEREVWMSQKVKRITKTGEMRENGEWARMAELGGSPAGPHRPTYQWLASLPTDPDALLKELYRMATPDEDVEKAQAVFNRIGSFLGETVMPPENAAALYKAAAKIPGVTRKEDAVDAAGRHGVGIARVDKRSGEATEWVFDRDSLTLLGERSYLTRDVGAGKKGDVMEKTAYLKRGIVDHYRERPTG